MKMVQPDILHICHSGTARDLIGSAMRELTKAAGFFQGPTQAIRLRDATARLDAYCRLHQYTLSMRRLTTKSLQFTKGYPELRAKGYDAFVILRWLVWEIQTNRPPGLDLMCTCLWSLDSFLSVSTNAGKFFSEGEVQHLQAVGMIYLKSYLYLAGQALQRNRRLYRVRPKFHLMSHVILDIPASRTNFTQHSTWLDEDFNKHVVAIKAKTHRRQATARTLKRWLLGLPKNFRNAANSRG